jgi:hypothetical protein
MWHIDYNGTLISALVLLFTESLLLLMYRDGSRGFWPLLTIGFMASNESMDRLSNE